MKSKLKLGSYKAYGCIYHCGFENESASFAKFTLWSLLNDMN
jgi:hypothetical protein